MPQLPPLPMPEDDLPPLDEQQFPLPAGGGSKHSLEPLPPGVEPMPYLARRQSASASSLSKPVFWLLVAAAVLLPIAIVGAVTAYFLWPDRPAEQATGPEPAPGTPPRPAPTEPAPATPTVPHAKETAPTPPPAPKTELTVLPLEAVTLEAGSRVQVRVRVERRNCGGPVALWVEGLPAGIESRDGVIRHNSDEGMVELIAGANAPLQPVRARLIAEAAQARTERELPLTLVAQRVPPPLPALAVAPFDAAQARQHQEQWSKQTGQPAELANSIGMKLTLIPAGRFLMGTPLSVRDRKPDEHPHEVELTRSFHMGVHEVTQEQYAKVMGRNPAHFQGNAGGGPNHPVETVSWAEAVEFCQRLSDLPTEKAAGRSYRLPTEAEWEFACRAGTTTLFHYGDRLAPTEANFDGTQPYGGALQGPSRMATTPVGSFAPDAFGLFDMHGNVWEWCQDGYDKDFYLSSPRQDPVKATEGGDKVLRGGSWEHGGRYCFAAGRGWQPGGSRFPFLGFRVVMTMASRP